MAVRTETEGESVQRDMERAEKQPDEILASGLVPGSMRKARRGSWLAWETVGPVVWECFTVGSHKHHVHASRVRGEAKSHSQLTPGLPCIPSSFSFSFSSSFLPLFCFFSASSSLPRLCLFSASSSPYKHFTWESNGERRYILRGLNPLFSLCCYVTSCPRTPGPGRQPADLAAVTH